MVRLRCDGLGPIKKPPFEAAFLHSLSGQQCGEFLHRQRPAEQISLCPGTAQFAQDIQLFFGLHPLGNGADAHVARGLDDQAQQALSLVAVAQVIHQAFVQLELIEAQTRQGHEIGIGHAKVVDGHPEALVPDAVHGLLERAVKHKAP